MIARDVDAHFRQVGTWVDWDDTSTDVFKAGNPGRSVSKIAVAWKANWPALKEAHARGADLFISHESICVNALNGDQDPEEKSALPAEQAKFEWLRETELAVYRCHDFWDNYPDEGIRWNWQRLLRVGDDIVGDDYPYLVTRIDPMTLEQLAQHILEIIAPLGQNGVPVIGDPQTKVSRIATGTGVSIDPVKMMEMGADVGIMTDDYYVHVRIGELARELNFPAIVVNHLVAEERGIEALAAYVTRSFPAAEVFHLPQRCPYRVITA
jgi:putative NIF3 family GTP cyclohydrolase 1 type 2